MSDLVKSKLNELHRLCKKYDVLTMFLFGSAATGEEHAKSDIDFLISFKDISFETYTDNYFALHEELERLFEKKIDLLTERSLSNPVFKQSIEETKQLLYAA